MSMTIIVVSVVILCAAVIQGAAGFGFALSAAPVLSLLIPVREAVIVVTAVMLVLALIQSSKAADAINRAVALRMFMASLLGLPIGAVVFLGATEATLQVVVGLVAIASAALLLWLPAARVESRALDLLSGLLSGVLKTAVGANGPPLAVALQFRGLPKDEFRATMSALIAATTGAGMLSVALLGSVTALPLAVVGGAVGSYIAMRVGEESFRGLVLTLIAFSGVASAAAA